MINQLFSFLSMNPDELVYKPWKSESKHKKSTDHKKKMAAKRHRKTKLAKKTHRHA